jgi:hypothetical protein
MFQLKYFTGTKELVPAGWGSVDEDKEYPLLSSRSPQVLETHEDDQTEDDFPMSTGNRRVTSDAGSSDIEEEDDAPQLAPTQMNEESSDDDELAPNSNLTRVRLILIYSSFSPSFIYYLGNENVC